MSIIEHLIKLDEFSTKGLLFLYHHHPYVH